MWTDGDLLSRVILIRTWTTAVDKIKSVTIHIRDKWTQPCVIYCAVKIPVCRNTGHFCFVSWIDRFSCFWSSTYLWNPKIIVLCFDGSWGWSCGRNFLKRKMFAKEFKNLATEETRFFPDFFLNITIWNDVKARQISFSIFYYILGRIIHRYTQADTCMSFKMAAHLPEVTSFQWQNYTFFRLSSFAKHIWKILHCCWHAGHFCSREVKFGYFFVVTANSQRFSKPADSMKACSDRKKNRIHAHNI